MPVLSIIVPVYNTSGELEACLDSILAQEFRDFELILVDDGSTDRSPEICRGYRDREPDRITFLSGPNRGVGAARNRGLDIARGEWIAFCDSDDRVNPALYCFLHQRAVEADADLSCCALRQIFSSGEKIMTDFPFPGEVVVEGVEEVRRRCFMPLLLSRPGYYAFLPICLFRRDRIEEAGIRFVEGLNLLEDVAFLLEYLLHVRRLAASDRLLYDYLRSEHSLCAQHFSARGALKREQAWTILEQRRLEIFLGSGFSDTRPELVAEFRMRVFYHEVQAACCDGALSGRARREKLRGIARRARRELGAGAPFSGLFGRNSRIFLLALLYCRPLLPLLCEWKRKRDGK